MNLRKVGKLIVNDFDFAILDNSSSTVDLKKIS
jgi:hypothetical protein